MPVRTVTPIIMALLTCCLTISAFAQDSRTVDPEVLPPAARDFALHGKLYDRDPLGDPSPGCIWSRIQVPTAQGLRWVAEQECNPNADQ